MTCGVVASPTEEGPRRRGPRRWVWLTLLALLGLLALTVLVAPQAAAQTFSLNMGDDLGGNTTAALVRLVALLTVLSVAPSILLMVTSFTRIVIVLSLLRTALGTQSSPSNMVVISLALFLTAFIMAPVFERAYQDGIRPLMDEQIDIFEAYERVVPPFKEFMLLHTRKKDLALFVDMADMEEFAEPMDTPLQVLIPAFMISELRRAFEIGFLIFIPFLIIDMTVASVLMSMGMMMLPPIMISLPFKLIFFVLVDGWYLVVGTLSRSFLEPGAGG